MSAGQAMKHAGNAYNERGRKRLEATQARKQLACEECGATHEDLHDEQARKRAEFYARNPHLLPGALS